MEAKHTATPWAKYKTQDGKFHIDIPGDGVIDIVGANAEENAEFVFRACNEFDARGTALQVMTAKADRLESVNADLVNMLTRVRQQYAAMLVKKGIMTRPTILDDARDLLEKIAKAGAA